MVCNNCGAQIREGAKFCRNCGAEADNGKCCPSCGNRLKPNSLFCGVCGKQISENKEYKTYCKKCGEELKYGALFCNYCGTPANGEAKEEAHVENAVKNTGKQSNTALIVLIILLSVILAGCLGLVSFMYIKSYIDNDDEIVYVEKEMADDIEDEIEDELEEAIEELTEEEYSSPIFLSVKATSVLPVYEGNTYVAENLRDGLHETAWTEGVEGSGIGEKIKFTANERQKISGIRILNGYCKSEEVYLNNNRVNEIKIRCSSGEIFEANLVDKFNEYSVITFREPVVCSEIELEILSVYYSDVYDDTVISEIEFF